MSNTNEPAKKSFADAMRGLCILMLTAPVKELPTPEFPHVCRDLMDMPLWRMTRRASLW